jgi:macrophage erythroblast attacher
MSTKLNISSISNLNQVTRELAQIVALLEKPHHSPTSDSTFSAASLHSRLLYLRETLIAADAEEKKILECCHRKIQALTSADEKDVPGAGLMSDSNLHASQLYKLSKIDHEQLERLIGEYLLRQGYLECFRLLEDESHGGQTGAGVFDLGIFLGFKDVEQQLVGHRDCAGALAWCADHSSRLRRLGSPLEFKLHKQQFLEMVRQKDRLGALEYASQHFSPQNLQSSALSMAPRGSGIAFTNASANSGLSGEQLVEVQQAMATLALGDPEDCRVPDYSQLFAVERWQELGAFFSAEARRCYGMTTEFTALEACIQAALTALKTPSCRRLERGEAMSGNAESQETYLCETTEQEDSYNQDCPVCSDPGRSLAVALPLSHCGNSYLTCACTGEAMDAANPPMLLPNGRVYSQRAVREHLTSSDGCGENRVTCPRTRDSFPLSKVRNIYVV